jgi:hypothetical protein
MPDTDKAAPKAGKAKLAGAERKARLVHHMSLLRAKNAEVEELRAPLKTAQDEFTALVNDAKSDLGKGYTRKHLMTLLEDSTSRLRDLLREENSGRSTARRWACRCSASRPTSSTGEATAKMPAEARDELHYEAEGFMRGRNGALEPIPEGTPPRFHQAVLRGFEKGQELTRADVLAAMEARKREQTPDAGAEAKPLNTLPEPGTPEHEAVLEASEKLARESLEQMGAGGDGDGEGGAEAFEAPVAELAAQKPRLAVVDGKAGRTSGEPASAVA